MAARQRRSSLGRLLDFSDLTNLIGHAASFIAVFDFTEPKMRQIVKEFHKIVDEVKKTQQKTDKLKRKGAVKGGEGLRVGLGVGLAVGGVGGVGGVGLGLMILAAPFTGGLSLLAAGGLAAAAVGGVAGAAVGGAAGAAAGGAAVVEANKIKKREEKESARKVKELGKEFMKIVESLKNDLEEIKRTCEELEQRSAEGQAVDMKFQRILGRVSELRRRSGEVLVVTVAGLKVIDDKLKLLKLRDSIIQSADQCQKVIDAFDQMKKELSVIMQKTKSSE